MRTFTIGLFSLFTVVLGLPVCGIFARADDAQPLDARQKEIANIVTDKLIERIKALKPQFPELAKFGEAPWFTRGDGEFRYDYQVDKGMVNGKSHAQARSGGCGIYFRLYAVGNPNSPWTDYYGWASVGGDRAGITHELAVAVDRKSNDDDTHAALIKALQDAQQMEDGTTFARLTSEYVLSKKGIALDVPFLLAALEIHDSSPSSNRFNNTSVNAMIVLRSKKLTSAQLDQIKKGFRDGKYPWCDVSAALQIIDEQDHASLSAFMGELIDASLQAEQSGNDTFQKTPFFDQPWMSDARSVRQEILWHLANAKSDALVPVAMILASDTDLENRTQALGHVEEHPGPAAQKVLVDALQNSFRTIQAEVAEDCGKGKIDAAADRLRLLLDSPSSKVREAATTALKQLGKAVPQAVPPPLPDSARQIAAALWAHGLRDDDFLVLHALPWPNKAQMTSLDAASIKKVTSVYAVQKLDRTVPWIHTTPPGPFILAAAIKYNDEDSAKLVYGRMCDTYETDEAALADGMDNLGWDRFSVALDQFHHKNDEAAVTKLSEVIALSEAARPFSLLSMYVKQSRELLQYLKTRPPDTKSPVPDKSDTAAYVKYWIGNLKDCDGETPSGVGVAIREVGLPALPFLIDALNDKTPTRNFSYGRSYLPERDFIYIGTAAKNLIECICRDYGLTPLDNVRYANSPAPDLQEKLRAWIKTVPMDAKRVVAGPPDRDALNPAGEYYWGDD